MQEETKISNQIKEYLNSKRIFNRRNQAIASSYGLPDREFLYKGICVGIEVKVPGEAAKAHQKRVLKLYDKGGGVGFTVTSVDEVKKIVEGIDKFSLENKEYNTLNRQLINYLYDIMQLDKGGKNDYIKK